MHAFNSLCRNTVAAGAALLFSASLWACDLEVKSAWIREAPPNATTLAGYAVLKNGGSKPLTIAEIRSPAFGEVMMHESTTTNGVASMRMIDKLTLAAGEEAAFATGGKHLMLMNPKQALRKGDVVTMQIKDGNGCVTNAAFKVTAAQQGEQGDHASMDHSTMDHSKMHHGT